MLAVFATEATWDDLAAALVTRYRGLADRLVLYVAGFSWGRGDGAFARLGEVARGVRELTTARER